MFNPKACDWMYSHKYEALNGNWWTKGKQNNNNKKRHKTRQTNKMSVLYPVYLHIFAMHNTIPTEYYATAKIERKQKSIKSGAVYTFEIAQYTQHYTHRALYISLFAIRFFLFAFASAICVRAVYTLCECVLQGVSRYQIRKWAKISE